RPYRNSFDGSPNSVATDFRKKLLPRYGLVVGETTFELEMLTWFAITLPVTLTWLMVTVRFSANKLPLILELVSVTVPVPRILNRTCETGTFTKEIFALLSEKFLVTLMRKAVVAVPDKVKVAWLKTKSVSLSTTFSLAPPVIVRLLLLRLTLVRVAYRGVTDSAKAASESILASESALSISASFAEVVPVTFPEILRVTPFL